MNAAAQYEVPGIDIKGRSFYSNKEDTVNHGKRNPADMTLRKNTFAKGIEHLTKKALMRDAILDLKKSVEEIPRGTIYSQPVFRPLKKSEGQIIHVDKKNKEVLIRFSEIGGDPEVIEEAVFDFEEINPSDHDLLQEGTIVYWHIGYLDQAGEGRQRISRLSFRRMPIWSNNEIDKANETAKSLKDFFSK